jgi:vanillate O-demethylase monooxygenase subunit
MKASYVSLHENLLDLTHLSYLHARSFGTPDYARAPYDVSIEPGRFTLTRRVVPTKLPPIWARSTGLADEGAARIATSEFLAPGLHETTATFYDTRLPERERREFTAKAAHLPTPETATSTHYFVVDGRSFAVDDPAITDFMHEQLLVAFREDVDGQEAVQRTLSRTAGDADFYEFSVASDRASIEMRKHLRQRAERQP